MRTPENLVPWPVSMPGPPPDLCLAFANTLSWRGRPAAAESLLGFEDLLGWLAKNAGWPAAALDGLGAWSRDDAATAGEVFAGAIALREAIYRVFAALASEAPAGEADLAGLARALAQAPPRVRLARRESGFAWRLDRAPLSAPLLLAPVLWSAADLAAAPPGRHRLRRCANEECLWLFVDASRTGSRRWCDMSSCGNRAKARRHYQRVTAPARASRREG